MSHQYRGVVILLYYLPATCLVYEEIAVRGNISKILLERPHFWHWVESYEFLGGDESFSSGLHQHGPATRSKEGFISSHVHQCTSNCCPGAVECYTPLKMFLKGKPETQAFLP